MLVPKKLFLKIDFISVIYFCVHLCYEDSFLKTYLKIGDPLRSVNIGVAKVFFLSVLFYIFYRSILQKLFLKK